MDHHPLRLPVVVVGLAAATIAPVLSADVLLEYELIFNGVTGSLGDTSFRDETMTITLPGSVGSIYEEDGSYQLGGVVADPRSAQEPPKAAAVAGSRSSRSSRPPG